MTIIDTDGKPRSKRSLKAEIEQIDQYRRVQKRQKCLTNKEVARLAVRLFNGETQAKIAKELGISSSYLGRLIAKAQKAGAFHYSVTRS